MKIWRNFALAAMTLAFAAISETAYGWEPLFDGKSTENWIPRTEVELFEAKDGEMHLFSKRNVWVVSKEKMKNFEVECEVKIPLDYKGFNSGLGFRLSGGEGKPKGYQCEIDQSKPAGIYGIGMGGWLHPTNTNLEIYQRKIKDLFVAERWNHFRVICNGTKCITFLNGHKIAEINSVKEVVGHFGIQHHGKGGIVKFRNIKVKKIN